MGWDEAYRGVPGFYLGRKLYLASVYTTTILLECYGNVQVVSSTYNIVSY